MIAHPGGFLLIGGEFTPAEIREFVRTLTFLPHRRQEGLWFWDC